MDNFQLKVDSQVLKAQSTAIKTEIDGLKSDITAMSTLIKNMKSFYWKGDASDSHDKDFKDQENHIKNLISRLTEHPTDIEKMAGVYEEVEKQLVNTALALESDIII